MANINDKLIENIDKNNIDEVIKLLDKGADINYHNCLPLITSVETGSLEITKLLLDRGTDINYNHGYLLYFACKYISYDMVELLLKEGIQYDRQTHGSLIGFCIVSDDIDSLKILIHFNIIHMIEDEYFDIDDDIYTDDISIWDACVKYQSENILEFVINNYQQLVPNNIHIRKKYIKKYNFIKMLVNRNIIDVAD